MLLAVQSQVALAFLSILSGGFLGEYVSGQLATEVELELLVSSGLGNDITDVQNAGDSRLFVVRRSCSILVVEFTGGVANVLPVPFMDISGRCSQSGGERGLLGLAFHPQYATNGHFFVNYISSSGNPGNTIISRFSVTGDPNVADPSSEVIVAEIVQDFTNHNGGQIQFGPVDGYLYIGMGDGGSANDPNCRSQDTTSLLGKMLRVDVDSLSGTGTLPIWSIPTDNPFVNDPGTDDAIWAIGLRNPWRFSFDEQTGDLFIADVGQGVREIVHFEAAGSAGGLNYGWGYCEGTFDNTPTYDNNCDITSFGGSCDVGNSDYDVPILEYVHQSNQAGACSRCETGVFGFSITGGYVYRGSQYATELGGTYFYADYVSEKMWGARNDGSGNWANAVLETSTVGSPSTFGEDVNGELYLATLGSTDGGRLYRVKPKTVTTPTEVPTSAPVETCVPSPPPATIINCPPSYDVTIDLTTDLELSYAVRIPGSAADAAAYGGILCARLVYQGQAWLGFASSTDTNMQDSEAVIGMPGTGAPAKYYMGGTNIASIVLMSEQTLRDAVLVQDSTTTTMTYTKILKEDCEIEIDGTGSNTFLWAHGTDNAFGYHGNNRGSIVLDFSPQCSVDGDCPGNYCSPGACIMASSTCSVGPSPCPPAETCQDPLCDPCDSCDNNQGDCDNTSGCTFTSTSTVPVCAQDGNCGDCGPTDCVDAGCNWNSRRSQCKGSPSGGTGGQGTCAGLNPVGQCASPCVPNEDPEVTCNDGVDNDCDGATDLADTDCCLGFREPCTAATAPQCCSGVCKRNGRWADTCE